MKIYIRIFQYKNFGNYRSDILLIPSKSITVSDLKELIYQKNGIKTSNQLLTVKILNKELIQMIDEFPLFYFFIKENSIINVEILFTSTKEQENINKIKQKEVKSKYLRKLSIFQKNPKMEVIRESKLEDIDDFHDNENPNYNEYINEKFNKSIIENNIIEFREIMKDYNDCINIDNTLTLSKNYSAIHYACIYGYKDLLKDLIYNYESDVNLISENEWGPLHISSYKGYLNIVYILICFPKTDCNLVLPKIGTALHCACKNNNFKIVAMLLHKCDPLIKNNEGLLPIEVTTNINIKKLINKVCNGKFSIDNNENGIIKENHNHNKIDNNVTKYQLSKYKFLNKLSIIPSKPPNFIGYIYKKGKILGRYNLRYIEIDPVKGFLLRFLKKEDYPSKPIEMIFLKDITNCKKINTNNENFFIEITLNETIQMYKLENKSIGEKWLEVINQCITYNKFWKNLEKKYDEVTAYLSSLPKETFEINFSSGELNKKENNKPIIKSEIQNNISNGYINNKNNIYSKDTQLNKLEKTIFSDSDINLNSFDILECQSKGIFCQIYKVKMKSNEKIYTMKVLNKKNLIKKNQLKHAITQINILKGQDSPFITKLHYAFKKEDNFYLIIDYCPGEDLNFHTMHNFFEENDAKFYIAELILAIEHLHKSSVIYNNLKPENILINNDNHIKLSDFNFIKNGFTELQENTNGNFFYYNQETILMRGHGKNADIFDIGAILYEMVCGTKPFFNLDDKKNYNLMMYDFFSEELKDLLLKLLSKDPVRRIGVVNKGEIKNHLWFKNIDWEKLSRKEIDPPLDLVNITKEILDDKNNNANKIIDNDTTANKFKFIRENNNYIL